MFIISQAKSQVNYKLKLQTHIWINSNIKRIQTHKDIITTQLST